MVGQERPLKRSTRWLRLNKPKFSSLEERDKHNQSLDNYHFAFIETVQRIFYEINNEKFKSLCLTLPEAKSNLCCLEDTSLYLMRQPETLKKGGISVYFPIYQDHRAWLNVNIACGIITKVVLISKLNYLEQCGSSLQH